MGLFSRNKKEADAEPTTAASEWEPSADGADVVDDGRPQRPASEPIGPEQQQRIDAALARFDATGKLDTTFGTNGIAKIDFGAGRATSATAFVGDTMWGMDSLPGDKIAFRDQTLFVNGEAVAKRAGGVYVGTGFGREMTGATLYEVDLPGQPHRSLEIGPFGDPRAAVAGARKPTPADAMKVRRVPRSTTAGRASTNCRRSRPVLGSTPPAR